MPQTAFAKLPDELQTELSLTVAAVRQKKAFSSYGCVDIFHHKLVQGFIQKREGVTRKQLEFKDVHEVDESRRRTDEKERKDLLNERDELRKELDKSRKLMEANDTMSEFKEKLKQERKAWTEEKEQFINQIQELRKEFSNAKSEHEVTKVMTGTDSRPRTSRPKIPQKPMRQLPVTFAQPKPLPIPVAQPTNPSRFELVVVSHHRTTQNNMNKRQVFNLKTHFKKLQNELQSEVSMKIALLRQKMSNENVWNICAEKSLQESRTVKSQRQYKATQEKREELRQEILQEECNFSTFQNEIQRDKTRTEKHLTALQEKINHLETSPKSKVNDNEKLSKSLQESQLVADNVKALNQQEEQKAAEREKLLSMQPNESMAKSRLSETEIYKLYQIQIELEKKVREYIKVENMHQHENREFKERNEALSNELALDKQQLGDQAKCYEEKMNKTESRLRETEKKLEETELNLKLCLKETQEKLDLKLSLKETEEKLKATETKLTESEAQLTETQMRIEEFRAQDWRTKILDLEHKQEQDRNAWMEEKEQLVNQIQEQRRLIVELQDKYKSDPVLVQTIKTKKNKWIRGMTILENELFVVSEWSSEVEVYDSMIFSFKRRWKLKEYIDPRDTESCNRNKCLYIIIFKCGDSSNEILRVDPNGKLIKNWSTGGGWGLSVTNESNIILTVFDQSYLMEYSSDGQLIREINLSSHAGILHPIHAIKLTNGDFLVIHGSYGDHLHRVCVVDVDGNLKKAFGGNCGSTIGQMNQPSYLAVDGDGFVMVADQGNSRVLLLDSDLQFKREILSEKEHEIQNPKGIVLNQTNNRLFVISKEWDSEKRKHTNERILIFEFK